MKTKTKKNLLRRWTAVFVLTLILVAQGAFAEPSAGDVLDEAETRYGYDANSLRRSQRKVDVPEVDVFLDKTDPTEGERVTASAIPRSFQNTNEKLYYTWYVIHTDDNGEPTNTIEEGKKEAMGIIARGAFDAELFGIDYGNINEDDNDGFDAPVGGFDGVGSKEAASMKEDEIQAGKIRDEEKKDEYEEAKAKGEEASIRMYGEYEEVCFKDASRQTVLSSCISRCFKHNFGEKENAGGDGNSGKDMIVECEHKFPTCSKYEVGDGDFGVDEEKCWGLDPTSADTDGDGTQDEADLAGLNQSKFTWNFHKGDRVGVVVEGTSMVTINEDTLNSYYKIMWATPNTCSNNEDGFIDGDECDDKDDYYFNYLEAVPVNAKGHETIDFSLDYSPQNPQFNSEDDLASDDITVFTRVKTENIDKNFLYFDWSMYRCDNVISGTDCEKINLGDCQLGSDDNDCPLNMKTALGGQGLDHITFKPKPELLGSDSKAYLKVVSIVKRFKSDTAKFASDILIPVNNHDLQIKLYRTVKREDGYYEIAGNPICEEGAYRAICPVYPFGVLAAKIETGNDYESFNWKINGSAMPAPVNCAFKNESGENSCGDDDVVYFPVMGEDKFLETVSVMGQKDNGSNVIAERILSVNSPMASIASADLQSARQIYDTDGKVVGDNFEADADEMVSFRANLIPDYLSADEALVEWYINGERVDEVGNLYEVSLSEGNIINFKMPKKAGNGVSLTARVEKKVSDDEQALLFGVWNIKDFRTTTSNSSVSVKSVLPSDFFDQSGEGEAASIGLFLASTAKNAPEHLIFVARTALVLVIFGLLMFGASNVLVIKK